jgi:hypothetical protein
MNGNYYRYVYDNVLPSSSTCYLESLDTFSFVKIELPVLKTVFEKHGLTNSDFSWKDAKTIFFSNPENLKKISSVINFVGSYGKVERYIFTPDISILE